MYFLTFSACSVLSVRTKIVEYKKLKMFVHLSSGHYEYDVMFRRTLLIFIGSLAFSVCNETFLEFTYCLL